MNIWINTHFFDLIEFIGTFAFAISGIRLASAKNYDLFGAYVVGFVTAVGGGTFRDLFIGITPFWMLNPIYLWCTLFAMIFVMVFKKKLVHLNNTFFYFDSIGLGLFVVVGVEKALNLGFPSWVAILMGAITGALGGVIRDILIMETPLIFRKEIYALACIVGGIIFVVLKKTGFNIIPTELVTALSVISIRYLAVRYQWLRKQADHCRSYCCKKALYVL